MRFADKAESDDITAGIRIDGTTIGAEHNVAPQFMAQAQAKARWVELPNCNTLQADDVPLKADLSNAVFATCKSYNPNYVESTPTPPGPTA
jgi:hypothetical protein